MFDSSIPAYVDTRKIFLQQGSISGELGLERLPRVTKSLADDQGSVSIDLHFQLNDAKQRLILGSIKARLNVICQRCLKALAIELTDDIKLVLVKDEEAVKQLEAELDPWICQDHKLDLANLVEEQLILCMPIVSYHESGECVSRKSYVSGERGTVLETTSADNPFAILKSLKKSDLND